MDSSIRSLICTAQNQAGANQIQALNQAYKILRTVAENRPAVVETDAFNSDLYVLCAEKAYQYGLIDMTRECLKMFFMKPPPANQFLCRAYLCQAQLIAPHDANNSAQLEKAVVYIVKAITIAKTSPRYHFIVYNASVIYWQFCRPFLKPGYRQFLATSLHQIVKALDDIDDQDFEWRAQLMIGLIECHLDAGRRSDASHIALAAATFIKQNVPVMFKQVFGLMVHNQLVESSKLHKDIKNSPELSVYYKICKIKLSLDLKEQKDYCSEIQGILNQMGLTASQTLSQTAVSDRISRKDSRMSTGRDSSTNYSLSQSGKDEETTPTKRSGSKTGRRTPTPTSSKRFPTDSSEKPYLLLELGRLCLELDLPELAESCVDSIKQSNIKDPKFFLELEFLDCEMMVKVLGEKQESYQKVSVDTRLQSMKRCEEAIMNSKRQGDPNIVHVGCVTQWNLSLPLQQPNLRHHIRKHLTVIAEALEEINSLLVQLRCQIHTELSHCEEDSEQIQVAMQHIKKALALDDGEVYRERLEVALHRLELRSELYQQPERPEDQAAMIIEQARNCDSGTIRMKRSLLVKAGEALSPDAFLLVLDSESETRDITSGKGPQTQITKLACKAQQFNKCMKKVEGHIKRLGDENDRERARLWADLAKTARKHEVWDVCRVAARFTLLYDDDRWKTVTEDRPATASREKESREDGTASEVEKKSASRMGSPPTSPDHSLPLYNKDLLRLLAEVNFILGEAYIHLLRSEKVELNNKPVPPEDTRKRPKGYIAKKPEEDPDWLEYCDWIKMLSETSTKSFLRGLQLGVVLEEAWLVCSAAAYIWNYNNHVLAENRHREILDTLSAVLDGLRQVGHAGETVMLVNICNALAYSLILPWIPAPTPKEVQEPPTSPSPDEKGKDKKPVRANVGTARSKGGVTVTISSEAQPDLKKAIEVCEYGMQVTNGDNPRDIVPISIRLPLLQTWVCVKQMALQQIPKTLGTDDETNMEGQKGMTKAIVATEMSALSKNGIMEFKEGMNLTEITQLVENCRWSEKFIELQLWSKLTFLAFDQKQHSLVLKCSDKALRFAVVGTQPKNRKMDPHRAMVEQEMLSYTSCILGQSLMVNMAGKNSIRRQAMEAFLNSARYARNAKNYCLVMSAARHYWNACVPLLNQPIERELLKEPVRVLLQCISATADSPKKEDKQDKTGQGEGILAVKGDNKQEEKSSRLIGGIDDDLSLRAALYGLLFQAYSDRGEWEESMVAMDQAIRDMPRTKHRLLIFKHRVMVKARLGQDVQMDIQKFKDESEDYVADMWRRVALSSKVTAEQLSSYQNAIEALTEEEIDVMRFLTDPTTPYDVNDNQDDPTPSDETMVLDNDGNISDDDSNDSDEEQFDYDNIELRLQEKNLLNIKRFIVSENKLKDLLSRTRCQECNGIINSSTIQESKKRVAAGVIYNYQCENGHDSHWVSTEYYASRSVSAILVQLMILLSGLTWEPVYTACSFIRLSIGGKSQFYKNQMVYRTAIQKYFNKHIERLTAPFREKEVVLAVDVRYDSPGFCSNKATAVFMEVESRKIIHMEISDSREVERKSPRMERYLITKGLRYLQNGSINISELVSDASSTIIKILESSEFRHIHHSLDVWHKAKSLVKRLVEIARKAPNRDILPWIRPIINHFWYCCSRAKGDANRLVRKWFGLLHHITNRHDWLVDRCRHGDVTPAPEGKKWLDVTSTAYKNLRQIIEDKTFLGSMKFYTRCRQTWAIENFYSHTLLRYCPKRLSFTYDSYSLRNQLAVIDYNNHLSRGVRTTKLGIPVVCGQFSRRTKQWVAYEKLKQKEYDYIPEIIIECMHELYIATDDSYRRGKHSRELDEIAPNLSGEVQSNTWEVYENMKKRKH